MLVGIDDKTPSQTRACIGLVLAASGLEFRGLGFRVQGSGFRV